MINNLKIETQKYMESEEYENEISIISRFFELSEDEEGILFGKVYELLLGNFKEEDLFSQLLNSLDTTTTKARGIEERVKKDIVTPFKQRLVKMLSNPSNTFDVKAPIASQTPSPIQTLRQQKVTPQTPPTPIQQPKTAFESLAKKDILHQIENPPRTVIKRYVLEHEPITDPEHLIDDTIDERPKLEDHH